MAQSASKRVEFASRPKNRRNLLKVAKRTKNNYIIINKLTQKQ